MKILQKISEQEIRDTLKSENWSPARIGMIFSRKIVGREARIILMDKYKFISRKDFDDRKKTPPASGEVGE